MRVFITGGAGFIGANLSDYFLGKNWEVNIFDNFSRAGSKNNIFWIKNRHKKGKLLVQKGDLKDFGKLKKGIEKADAIFHLAGQVAVTSSLSNPRSDFEDNLLGTLNVLEAVRLSGHKPAIIFSSTNKVYGALESKKIKEGKLRYDFLDGNSISEDQLLDFYSPYGCSKGAADQYVRDYYRMYGIPTVVFRQSCIYGPRQMGMEDQGWTAYFAISTVLGKPITIYGNGKQVRDLLEISDLTEAYKKALDKINKSRGQIYNIGGGFKNSFSLLEYIEFLEKTLGKKIKLEFKKERPGDQKVFISDNQKLKKDLGWEPKIRKEEGLKKLVEWVRENKGLFQ